MATEIAEIETRFKGAHHEIRSAPGRDQTLIGIPDLKSNVGIVVNYRGLALGMQTRNQPCRVQQLIVEQPGRFVHAGLITAQGGDKVEKGNYGQYYHHQESPDGTHAASTL
jgi:hypothetical protein